MQKCNPAKVFACNCEFLSACAVWTSDSHFYHWKKSCLRRNICPEVSCSTVAYAVQTWHRQKNMLNRTIVTDPINQLEASENELSATMDSHPVAVSASVRVTIFAGFPLLQTCARRPSVCCQINHLEAADILPSGTLLCAVLTCNPAMVFACNCELLSACALWTSDCQ